MRCRLRGPDAAWFKAFHLRSRLKRQAKVLGLFSEQTEKNADISLDWN
jgi:hypothetical protein